MGFARCNGLNRNVSVCSSEVNVKLLKTLCCNMHAVAAMYCVNQYEKDTIRRLGMGYNPTSVKKKKNLKYDLTYSASDMYPRNNVLCHT